MTHTPSASHERAEPARPVPHANSYWIPGTNSLAGDYPGDRTDEKARAKLGALLDAGVRRFIDLTRAGESGLRPYDTLLAEEARKRGVTVRYTRLTIPDMRLPESYERMREVLDALDSAEQENETAYVHCWGGVGRTGTVVGCHLVRRGTSGDRALAMVTDLFATMSEDKRRGHPEGSPQTDAQRDYVRLWSERHA
jgi:protein-tyrosine phosphatase